MDGQKHPSNMHTVFLGECTQYFQWMSIGMYYSHQKSGQPGPITRVMCCSDEERDALPQVSHRSGISSYKHAGQ